MAREDLCMAWCLEWDGLEAIDTIHDTSGTARADRWRHTLNKVHEYNISTNAMNRPNYSEPAASSLHCDCLLTHSDVCLVQGCAFRRDEDGPMTSCSGRESLHIWAAFFYPRQHYPVPLDAPAAPIACRNSHTPIATIQSYYLHTN
jgi:hypothetical protein